MILSELWRLSKVVYKEVSFQSIFSLRSGGIMPQKNGETVLRLVKNAELNTLINKALTTMFILIFAAVIFIPHPFKTTFVRVPEELSISGDVSAFLSVVLFMIVIMGLQVTTALVSSGIINFLTPLPLSKSDVSKIILFCFLRMFDLPLMSAAIVFILNYGIIKWSPIGLLSSLLGIFTTEIFALALTVALSSFFYYRLSTGNNRSRLKSLLRLAYIIIWILPALGTYLIANFATQIAQSFIIFTQMFSPVANLLALIYPFSFGFLVSYSMLPKNNDVIILNLSTISSINYLLLAAYSLRWSLMKIRKIGSPESYSVPRISVEEIIIRPKSPFLGLIQKDFRVASRSPSYSSLLFMPAVQTAVLTLSFLSLGEMEFKISISILIGVAIVTLLIPPTLLSIEDVGYSYTRSLPINWRTLIAAKTAFSIFSYVTSFLTLMAIAAITGINFWNLMGLGIVHIFSIASASMMELIMLFKEFYEKRVLLGNIYLRLYAYIPTVLLGMAIVTSPLIVAFISHQIYKLQMESTLLILLLASISEFTIAISLFFRRKQTV